MLSCARMSAVNLFDLLPSELEALAESLGAPRYRGRQIATWIYKKGCRRHRRHVRSAARLPASPAPRARSSACPRSSAGRRRRTAARRSCFASADGARVQSVLMPDGDRLTLCVSTQVGCGFACAFCYTGTMGLERNLERGRDRRAGDRRRADARPGPPAHPRRLHGHGRAARQLPGHGAVAPDPDRSRRRSRMSPRRITVSTVGLVAGIERLARENLRVNLAISLHATSNEIRDRIMPVNKGFAIEELLAACKRFPLLFRQRMTFEYVLLEDVNDSPEDARRLVRLLKGIRGKVNLIPFNDWEGSSFARPPLPRIIAFQGHAPRARHHRHGPVEQGRGHRRGLRPAPRGRARRDARPGTVAVSHARLPAQPGGVAGDPGAVGGARLPAGRGRTSAPQVHVVNTCTVTGRADFSDRQTIRRIARDNPGRASSSSRAAMRRPTRRPWPRFPGVDLVVGNQEKYRLPDLLGALGKRAQRPEIRVGDVAGARGVPIAPLAASSGRSRAFVKIQDGCQHRCAFCIVPAARGGEPEPGARRRARAGARRSWTPATASHAHRRGHRPLRLGSDPAHDAWPPSSPGSPRCRGSAGCACPRSCRPTGATS